MTLQLRRMVSG